MRPKKANINHKGNFHLGIILLFLVGMATSFVLPRYINYMNDTKKHIIIIAHRGASAYEPENTLRSFKRAIEMGVDIIERVHQNNLKIITWTVDNRGEAESLREAGIDGIVTNKPDIL